MVLLNEINERSQDILRHIVEAYVDTGGPVGSRTLSRRLNPSLSPATIRNVMADLEDAGLLYAPHTSAGRLPTESGLKLFVDGLLEVGNVSPEERAAIDGQCAGAGAQFRGNAERGDDPAFRPVELRRRGAGAEIRGAAQIRRVRAAVAGAVPWWSSSPKAAWSRTG